MSADRAAASQAAAPRIRPCREARTTPLSLRAFLASPHGRMPDLTLTRAEMDDLISYILSLRRP